ncbi:MAG: WbuC family cupin fold metalloprotein [Thermoanaerobaculum sp.]|nr:WbuC family cupin fold metalloprotein [Thermoanaerobaculum sp.]MDW7968165.1 WbuC family cupin fold metalloprotein [Thermoanaerobaculum sp.]
MSSCRSVSFAQLRLLALEAQGSPRRRGHHTLHPRLSDPIQRFFNVLQPGTYVRPHRHEEGRFELFVLLAGRAGVLTFGPQGEVVETHLLGEGALAAVEIPGGLMHTVVALAPHTVLFEVKPGPYGALTDKDFAPWAPEEGQREAAALLATWERHFPPDPTPSTP